MKKFFIPFVFLNLHSHASIDLPVINFKEAKVLNSNDQIFLQRLFRYACNGGITHSQNKKFIPTIYDYQFYGGKNKEHQFKIQFDSAENHAEIIYYQAEINYKVQILRDTRDGLCLIGKFSLRDIESYESNLQI